MRGKRGIDGKKNGHRWERKEIDRKKWTLGLYKYQSNLTYICLKISMIQILYYKSALRSKIAKATGNLAIKFDKHVL